MPHVGPFERAIRLSKVPHDRRVADLAARQQGVVAHRQLIGLGLGPDRIQRGVTAGRLHRIHVGVYAVGHEHLSQHGRWMAAVLACGPGAVLSHGSAAALWGILLTAGSLVDVASATRSRHNRGDIALHRVRALHEEDRVVRDGVPVTSVPRTLLDLAHGVLPRQLRRAIAEADRRSLLDVGAVQRLIDRSHGHRGVGRLRREIDDHRPPPATRSELERRFLDLCRAAGLPAPQANVLVAGVEVDMAWPASRLIVELDGYAFHRGRAAFEDDRERDAVLQVEGYRVLRITHRRLHDAPARVVEAVRSLLGA